MSSWRPFEEGTKYNSTCVRKPTGNSEKDGLEGRETRQGNKLVGYGNSLVER